MALGDSLVVDGHRVLPPAPAGGRTIGDEREPFASSDPLVRWHGSDPSGRSPDPTDAGWTFSSTLGPYPVRGANQIDAHDVTQVDGRPVLRPLGEPRGMPTMVR